MSDVKIKPALLQERDDLPRRLFHAAAAAFVVLVVGGWIVTWIAGRGVAVHVGALSETAPVAIAPREIEMVDQTLFAAHEPSRGNWADKQRELDAYQWVDRARGVARIPVERAMDLIASQDHVR